MNRDCESTTLCVFPPPAIALLERNAVLAKKVARLCDALADYHPLAQRISRHHGEHPHDEFRGGLWDLTPLGGGDSVLLFGGVVFPLGVLAVASAGLLPLDGATTSLLG